jgi:antitoxin component YwqK of YwqJK toxin-antitoxin module
VFLLIYKVELAVNKILIILSLVLLVSCGQSQEEKLQVEMEQQRIEMERQRLEKEAGEKLAKEKAVRIAAVTCSIMSETRDMDAAVRVREINEAREKIGGEPFLDGDDAITEAFEYGLCQELVLNENYDDTLQRKKDVRRAMERIAAEKRAEEARIAAEKYLEEQRIAAEKYLEEQRIAAEKKAERQRVAAEKQRIADGKPSVKEEFHYNGKLKSRANYQPKTDGGKLDGLYESYHKNGQLDRKGNYKDGRPDGLFIGYYENGQPAFKVNYKNGREDGIYKWYDENGQLTSKSCLKNHEMVDMTYCEK